MDTIIAHVEGDMNISNYIAFSAPIIFFATALTSKKRSIIRWMITLLFIYVFLLCTFVFNAIGRDVALQAQERGSFSPEFSMGLTNFNDRLLIIRVMVLISTGFLWVLAMHITKRWKD